MSFQPLLKVLSQSVAIADIARLSKARAVECVKMAGVRGWRACEDGKRVRMASV
jgi:hypothetical protein